MGLPFSLDLRGPAPPALPAWSLLASLSSWGQGCLSAPALPDRAAFAHLCWFPFPVFARPGSPSCWRRVSLSPSSGCTLSAHPSVTVPPPSSSPVRIPRVTRCPCGHRPPGCRPAAVVLYSLCDGDPCHDACFFLSLQKPPAPAPPRPRPRPAPPPRPPGLLLAGGPGRRRPLLALHVLHASCPVRAHGWHGL